MNSPTSSVSGWVVRSVSVSGMGLLERIATEQAALGAGSCLHIEQMRRTAVAWPQRLPAYLFVGDLDQPALDLTDPRLPPPVQIGESKGQVSEERRRRHGQRSALA